MSVAGAAAPAKSVRVLALLAAAFGLTGVAAGAFGAHGLKARLSPDEMAVFETAVRYQMWHALALLGTAWACSQWPGTASRAAGACFAIGIVLFSGSLYALALTGLRPLGAVTPFGGLALMGGWVLLGIGIAGTRARPG
ncbi:MAG TPA: DUF423 domain-containing protein [Burkholderiaceae bacterium]